MRYILLFIVLAACGPGPVRYAVPLPTAERRAPVGVPTLEVRDVTLPLYAGLEEIYTQREDGGLVSNTKTLWADDPQRGVTQALATALSRLTTARVAASPWPLDGLPEARLEVRFETLLARADGQFSISGQYFVARPDRDRAGRFSIQVPYQPGSVPSAASAQGQAIDLLARQIARDALGAAGV
jgi:uncharacterized lipoprotein YmbA